MNTAKLVSGTVFLGLPYVFSSAGWLGGIILITVIGSLNIYTMRMNMTLAETYPEARSFSQIGAQILGPKEKHFLNGAILFVQLSLCAGYIYFIGEQMDHIICANSGNCGNSRIYMVMMLVPTLPISLVNSYTILSYFSIVGLAACLCVMGAIIMFCTQDMATGDGCDPELSACEAKVFDGKGMLGHVGIALLMFEGNAAVFNVRAAAKNK